MGQTPAASQRLEHGQLCADSGRSFHVFEMGKVDAKLPFAAREIQPSTTRGRHFRGEARERRWRGARITR